MKRSLAGSALGGWLAATAGGCTTEGIHLAGPEQFDDVVLEVRITGGVAGVEHELRVAGSNRVVEGDAAPLTLGPLQWASLIDEVERAGLPHLGAQDFGAGCCDFFHYEIGYHDESGRAEVRGDATTLLPPIAAVAARLHALVDGTVLALVEGGALPSPGPFRSLGVEHVEQSGHLVVVTLRTPGECAPHAVDLVFDGEWQESSPIRTSAHLVPTDRGHSCRAVAEEVRRFDLRDVFAVYRSRYPTDPPGTPIAVTVRAPDGTAHPLTLTVP